MSEDVNEGKALDLQQRRKRAAVMQRYEEKIKKGRELLKKRIAPESNLKKRANKLARQLVRKRVAGERGKNYKNLSPAEKISIDKMLEDKGKVKLIKKLAMRLLPKVKKAEYERLKSYMKGQALDNLGAKEGQNIVNEHINELFSESFASRRSMEDPISSNRRLKRSGDEKKGDRNPIKQFMPFQSQKNEDTAIYKSLLKKAESSELDLEILGEVFDRGLECWNEDCSVTPEQYAFARVNSFINKGKTYFNEDADLQELSKDTLNSYVDKAYKEKVGIVRKRMTVDRDRYSRRSNTDDIRPRNDQEKQTDSALAAQFKKRNDGVKTALTKLKTEDLGEAKHTFGISPKFGKSRDPWSPDVPAPKDAFHPVTGKLMKNSKAYKDHVRKEYPKNLWAQHGVVEQTEPPEESDNTKERKRISVVPRDKSVPRDENGVSTRHQEILKKIVEAKRQGNKKLKPSGREVGTDSLVATYKGDTPMAEDVNSADRKPVVIPAYTKAMPDGTTVTIPAKTVLRKSGRKIVGSGNNHDGI